MQLSNFIKSTPNSVKVLTADLQKVLYAFDSGSDSRNYTGLECIAEARDKLKEIYEKVDRTITQSFSMEGIVQVVSQL